MHAAFAAGAAVCAKCVGPLGAGATGVRDGATGGGATVELATGVGPGAASFGRSGHAVRTNAQARMKRRCIASSYVNIGGVEKVGIEPSHVISPRQSARANWA